MEDRKSVLETTKPTGALERLSARNSTSRVVWLVVGVVALFVLVFLVATIVRQTSAGTAGIEVPRVDFK